MESIIVIEEGNGWGAAIFGSNLVKGIKSSYVPNYKHDSIYSLRDCHFNLRSKTH